MAENNEKEQAFSKLKEMRWDPINKRGDSLGKADTKNCYTIVYNGKKKKTLEINEKFTSNNWITNLRNLSTIR